VPVEVGLSDGVNTQVVSGLKAGDQVVIQIEAAQATAANPFTAPNAPPGGQSSAQDANRQPQSRPASTGGR
jgi:hypothetical protein